MSESLPSIASHLRQWAEELESMQVRLTEPSQEYTIEQAANKLRAALGDAYFSIKMELNFHMSTKTIEWTIYDGKKHHKEMPTLAAAVNAVLAANAPLEQPADPVKDAQQAVNELTPLPF